MKEIIESSIESIERRIKVYQKMFTNELKLIAVKKGEDKVSVHVTLEQQFITAPTNAGSAMKSLSSYAVRIFYTKDGKVICTNSKFGELLTINIIKKRVSLL